jgi:hypothetical protein
MRKVKAVVVQHGIGHTQVGPAAERLEPRLLLAELQFLLAPELIGKLLGVAPVETGSVEEAVNPAVD